MERDYNDIQRSPIGYDTNRSSQKKTGFERWTDDIISNVGKDIIMPTVSTIMNQFIDLICSSVKSAVQAKLGVKTDNYEYRRYGDWTTSGYSGNANYNPNRFNSVDGYPHSQSIGVMRTNGGGNDYTPWKNVGFVRQLDGEMVVNKIKDHVYKYGYITVSQFGAYCRQSWDWPNDNWGWTDLSSLGIRYNIADRSGLPFEFKGVPEPIYINKRGES